MGGRRRGRGGRGSGKGGRKGKGWEERVQPPPLMDPRYAPEGTAGA